VRGQSVELRWFHMLQDDQAPLAAWAEAATNLTRPAYEGTGYGGVMFFNFPPRAPIKPGDRPPLYGDILRGKTTPGIGDLLARRLRDAVARLATDKSPFRPESVSRLAAALSAWDAKGQLTTLRWWCDYLKDRVAKESDSGGPSDMEDLTRAYLARIEAADPTATADYADWIHSLNLKTTFALTQMYDAFYFAPVYSYPDDPAIKKLTHWLFEEPDSPWSIGAKGVDPAWVARATNSGLVAIPAFRALLLRQLENKNVVGNVEITKDNVMVKFIYGSGDSITDPETPPTGFKQDLRLCDIIACRFSKLAGFPRCEPYWPIERRDAAIAQTIAFLKKYGDRVARKATSQEMTLGDVPYSGPLHFDKLDHPATKEEAASGRAIFSLEGRGERRIIPLPQIPQQAYWTTLFDNPSIQTSYDDQNHATKSKVFSQECSIWQAEEVLVNGQWQRYFGLVAPHKLAMVPGAEIEFNDPSYYNPIGGGWAMRVALGPPGASGEQQAPFKHPAGDAVPVTVSIRNIKGIDVALPRPPGASITAEDIGLELSVEYTDRPNAVVFSWPPRPDPNWRQVSAKRPLRMNLPPYPSRLDSLQSTVLLQFNAADYFDLSKPGTYRLKAQFGKQNLFSAGRQGVEAIFELTK
jgi:hypothetical protein